MTNKSNVEITIEELKKIHGEYMVAKAEVAISGEYYKNEDEWKHKFFKPLATTLLSKLNKLDREAIDDFVKQILSIAFSNWCNEETGEPMEDEAMDNWEDHEGDYNKAIDQILTLIPEEGEVIAEGELYLSQDSGITIIKNIKYINRFVNVDERLYKYQGKKGRLIWIEEKE